MPNTLTQLIRLFDSRYIGTDPWGNKYYTRKKPDPWGRVKRFIVYRGKDDASLLPPQYHAWLHYIVDDFPNSSTTMTGGDPFRPSYQKPPRPNMSGSSSAYRPHRAPATGDYQPWSPAGTRGQKKSQPK